MRITNLAVSLTTLIALGALTACGAAPDSTGEDDETESTSDALLSCTPLTPAQRGYVKWNPGHYILGADGDRTKQAANFLSGYGNIAAVKGLQKEYFWSEFESTSGNYSWKQIDADIATLATKDKKLAIIIKYKYKPETGSSLPQYIRDLPNAVVDGVTVPSYYQQKNNAGQHANLGHPTTRNRFKALLKALSDRYDTNPRVVSVSFLETSASAASITEAQTTRFIDGFVKMHQYAGCTFKHTPLFQNLNYPRDRLAELTNGMVENGVGLGGPDTFFDSMKDPNNGLGYLPSPGSTANKGIYRYYPTLSNTIPIGQQAHHANLEYSTAENFFADPKIPHNLSPAASVDKVWDFAVAQLHPNYMFWQLGGGDPYGIALKARLTSSAGLPVNKTCPSVYGSTCQ